MEKKILSKKILIGIFWKFSEQILSEFISLIISVVLARLLLPSDYSVIAVVSIFISFANILISGGLNTALIQKKDSDNDDYNTVLIITTAVSVVLYFVLFFTSPVIASVYENPLLNPVIKVMGSVLIVNAIKSILFAYVSHRMEFKKSFWSTLTGTAVSGIAGITMAFLGMGVWALVAQHIIKAVTDTVVVFISTKFKVTLRFSKRKFQQLWNYGWKVFVTSIISVVYDNVSPLVIGVKFSTDDLAFYSKGERFPQITNSTITNALSSVFFPAMSKIQDDKEQLLFYTRRFVVIASYCIAPLMLGFLAVSDNFVSVLLTEKWLPASVYIRIFCVSYLMNIMTTAHLQVIRASGRSDILLILEIVKKSSYLIVLVLFVRFSRSPEVLAASSLVINIMAMIINGFPNRKLIGYGYRSQITDVFPNIIMAGVMATIVYLMNNIRCNLLLLLTVQIMAGVLIYAILSVVFKPNGYKMMLSYAKEYIKREADG